MAQPSINLTGRDVSFPDDEIIVSKTDTTGRMTYVNDVFLSVSGYAESELIGKQHSMIRHPAMPRCVFKLLWDTIKSGRELFAYVVNRCKNGDQYWVFAHVTPDFGKDGAIVGYHSNRRVARADALAKLKPLYARLLQEEQKHADSKQGLDASFRLLTEILSHEGKRYEEFVLGL
jgi:PAS domain S-box-containing protein